MASKGGCQTVHVYASFDPFPAAKGAATHIAAFLHALAPARGPWTLLTVEPSPDSRAVLPLPANVDHVPLASPGKTLIDRVLAFRRELLRWWGPRRAQVARVACGALAQAPEQGLELAVGGRGGLPEAVGLALGLRVREGALEELRHGGVERLALQRCPVVRGARARRRCAVPDLRGPAHKPRRTAPELGLHGLLLALLHPAVPDGRLARLQHAPARRQPGV